MENMDAQYTPPAGAYEGEKPAVAETQTTVAGTTPQSGLPSDNKPLDISGFEINDELKAKFKDGKLNGRFSNIQEVLDKLKETEDKYANTVREVKQTEQQMTEEQLAEQQKAEQQTVQQETINSLLPEFMANGMQLTPEMEKAATEVGIDIRDLKLGALEFKEKVTAAHNVVGGTEEYSAMLEWGKANMSEAQMKAFDMNVTNPNLGEYAIKGLYADYKAAIANGDTNRIEGRPANNSIKPYADRKELYADRDYLQSAKGRRDTAAQKMYKARLNATSDSVIYGR